MLITGMLQVNRITIGKECSTYKSPAWQGSKCQHIRGIYRGSYISAHVLMNLLNKFGESDRMRGLPCILSLFRNEFNKFNNTGARILDSIYHMTLKLLKNHIFGLKTPIFCHFYAMLKWW